MHGTKSCWIVCRRESYLGSRGSCFNVGSRKIAFHCNGKVNRHAGYDLGQAIAQLGIQATSRQIYLHQMGGFSIEAAKELWFEQQEPIKLQWILASITS